MQGIEECLVSRGRWFVVTGLLFKIGVSVRSATPSECNDFGLRNIIGDGEDWGFYSFTDHPCFMCLDGRRNTSLNAILILPCLHQEQPTDSRVIVNYGVRSESTINPLQTASGTTRQCETEHATSTQLTGEPVMLEERLGGDGIRSGGFVIRQQVYLLEPSDNYPPQSIICITGVVYENVRLANGTIVGSRVDETKTSPTATTAEENVRLANATIVGSRVDETKTSPTATTAEGTTPTFPTLTVAKTTTPSKASAASSEGFSLAWIIALLCVGIVIAFGCGFLARSKYVSCSCRNETKGPVKDGVVLTLTEDMAAERNKRNVARDNESYEQINENNAATLEDNMPNITHTYFQSEENPNVYSRNIFLSNL